MRKRYTVMEENPGQLIQNLNEKADKTTLNNVSEQLSTTSTKLNTTVSKLDTNEIRTNITDKVTNKEVYLKNGGRTKKWSPPSWFTPSLPINIFKKGKKFFTDFDVSVFKNTSGKTYYISPTGLNTNNGTTEGTPFLTFLKAYSVAASGDTICFLDGFYGNELYSFNGTKVQKSLNIIAKNSGKVIVSSGNDNLTYSKTPGASNVYQTARSSVERVLYIVNQDFIELKKASSIAECDALKGSYYTDTTNVYIHTFDDTVPLNKTYHALVARKLFHFEPLDSGVNIYMEGITCIGGTPALTVMNIPNQTINFYAKNVKVLYSGSGGLSVEGKNAFNIWGADRCFTQNCEAGMAFWDGFNYHSNNGVITQYIEVDNIGYENGNLDGSDSYQGSTSHDGCSGIRLNCSYFGNIGQNIADVNENTLGLILGCTCYDSKAQSNAWGVRTNINAKTAGTTLHVEGCYLFDSSWDIVATSNSTIHIADDNIYDTSKEDGGGNRPYVEAQ